MHNKKQFPGSSTTIYLIIALASLAGYYLYAQQILSKQDPIVHTQKRITSSDGSVCQALFSPDDAVKDTLLHLIAAEKQQIFVAIFALTDPHICQALIDAHSRGVLVEVVADRHNAQTKWSKVRLLIKHQVAVWVYPTGITDAIMHHKFILFFKNMQGNSLLWTGSYNFTRSASSINEENALILDAPHLIKAYKKQFERLKERSVRADKAMVKPAKKTACD